MREHVAAALRALADTTGGRITPERVVDSARSPDSPMHDAFEWDDTVAAHRHRLSQARALIRSVRVDVVTTEYSLKAPLYVRDPGAGRAAGYASLSVLQGDGDLAREAVVSEFGRAASALARAKAIAMALGVGAEIEELRDRVIDLRDRVKSPVPPEPPEPPVAN